MLLELGWHGIERTGHPSTSLRYCHSLRSLLCFHALETFAKPCCVLSGRDLEIKSPDPLLKELIMGEAASGLSVWQLPLDVVTGLLESVLIKVGQPRAGHCGDLITCRQTSLGFSFKEGSNIERPLLPRMEAGQVGMRTCCLPDLEATWCSCAPVCYRQATLHSAIWLLSVSRHGTLLCPTETTTHAYFVICNMWSPLHVCLFVCCCCCCFENSSYLLTCVKE